MKTLLLLLISMFALGTVANAVGHKRVAIKTVIKAIEEDPEKALKDFALFESRFEVVPDAEVLKGKTGIIEKSSLRYETDHLRVSLEKEKKYKFSCALEKFKTKAGVEKVRIRITEIL